MFTVLWVMEKYTGACSFACVDTGRFVYVDTRRCFAPLTQFDLTELHLEAKWNVWVLVIGMSVTMYQIALWLHRNPVFVTSLFQLSPG